jgi:hypothetical protein
MRTAEGYYSTGNFRVAGQPTGIWEFAFLWLDLIFGGD